MPCTVDTSYEDGRWDSALKKHHEKIETILEELLLGKITKEEAFKRTRVAKRDFADAYEEIFTDLVNKADIKARRKQIMGEFI